MESHTPRVSEDAAAAAPPSSPLLLFFSSSVDGVVATLPSPIATVAVGGDDMEWAAPDPCHHEEAVEGITTHAVAMEIDKDPAALDEDGPLTLPQADLHVASVDRFAAIATVVNEATVVDDAPATDATQGTVVVDDDEQRQLRDTPPPATTHHRSQALWSRFECPVCGMNLFNVYQLGRHLQRHKNPEERPQYK